MPFEGAGAISDWNLHFPAFELRPIDFSSISDVVVHVRYTSRHGNKMMKMGALNNVKDFLRKQQSLDKEGSFGLLDLKHDYPIEWHRLITGSYSGDSVHLDLPNIKERLPFYTKAQTVSVSNVYLLLKTKVDITVPITATINETTFTKTDAKEGIPSDFYCLTSLKKIEANKDGKINSKDKGVSEWPENDWKLDMNCSSDVARAIHEGYMVFSYSLTSPGGR